MVCRRKTPTVVVVVEVKNVVAVIVGAILVFVAAYGIMAYTEVARDPVVENTQPDVTFDGPIFAPAEGTEDFIFGTVEHNGKFMAIGTGIYEYQSVTVYGTLYTSDMGYWMVIDPKGQVTMSGGIGSTAPGKVTE